MACAILRRQRCTTMTVLRPRSCAFLLALFALLASVSASAQSLLTPSGIGPLDPSWSATGDLGTARYDHTATLLQSGQVLVVGGQSTPLSPALSSAELYDPATGLWTATGDLTTGRALHTATLLPSGQVLVAGGFSSLLPPNPLSSAELYDPATGLWTPTGDLNAARVFPTETLLPSGQVLLAGGIDFRSSLSSTEVYDPATGIWTLTGDLAGARGGHTATLLPSGQVLVSGGYDPSLPPPGVRSSAELYDPGTGMWSAAGDLMTARYDHMSTFLPSGQVLVAAGYSGVMELSSAELYDPATGSWTPTGDLVSARRGHQATLLPATGQVLVAGGITTDGGFAVSSAELYDPGTGQWTMTSSLLSARFVYRAVLLPSGQVLAAGGRDKDAVDGVALSSTELYP
jgi:WD40 repeat protein